MMRTRDVEQTRASFDYQWTELPRGEWSLANAAFRTRVPEYICELTGLDRQWFAGKDVLDAGCGAGRYAFGLCALGARVAAVDRSIAALAETRRWCAAFPAFLGAVAADLLSPLPLRGLFDLVWSYGVLHHTGDTHEAFRNVAGRVRPGGYLVVMLYGKPRPGHIEDYERLVSLEAWRHRCRELPFDATVEALKVMAGEDRLLEYFDAVSPRVNDRYGHDEISGWFAELGLVGLRRLSDDMDHYLMARRA
jgi:SAM-dependent methyltransferase